MAHVTQRVLLHFCSSLCRSLLQVFFVSLFSSSLFEVSFDTFHTPGVFYYVPAEKYEYTAAVASRDHAPFFGVCIESEDKKKKRGKKRGIKMERKSGDSMNLDSKHRNRKKHESYTADVVSCDEALFVGIWVICEEEI